MKHDPPLPESQTASQPASPAPHPRCAPHPRSAAVQNRRISRIPAFTPIPVRARRDGWTPLRQAEFLGYLAETRSVKAAAARVGMSRETAYRLRARRGSASFSAAWDAIMGGPPGTFRPKVSLDPLFQRIRYGLYRPVMRSGRYVGTLRKPDNSALRAALGRADRTIGDLPPPRETAEGRTKGKSGSA